MEAAKEIEALLATAPRISAVTPEQVAAIMEAYELDARRMEAPCRELYRRYFEYCLVDRALSGDERTDLSRLRELLQIDDHTASAIHDEVGFDVYGAAIDEVFEDNRVEAQEREFLQGLRADLNLDEETATRAFEEGRERARRRYLAGAVSSEDVFLASKDRTLELEGSSSESLESAIVNALEQAETVLPDLESAEVEEIRVGIDGGRVGEWRVKLRGALPPKD
jgi:flavin-binding protein dodecin